MTQQIELTDQEIINNYIAGDTNALNPLITRYKNKIFTSIYIMVKDRYLAEDLFQDVFIRVIDTIKAGGYLDEGKFLPWTMRIAHNLCVDHFRKVKRNPTIKTSDDRDIFECGAGKARQNFVVIQPSHFACGRFDHHIAKRDLPVAAERDRVATTNRHDGRAMKI